MTRAEKIEALRAARRQRSIEITAALELVVLAKAAGSWDEVGALLALVDQLDEARARTVGALDALLYPEVHA